MHYDCIIVGQGIAGTMLAHFLEKAGKKVVILDDGHKHASSAIAAGLINPITGRKYVKSWMIDELFPFAEATYKEIGDKLGKNYFNKRYILRALYGPEEENTFYGKCEDAAYRQYVTNEDALKADIAELFNNAGDYGVVHGAQVDIPQLIVDYRDYLEKAGNVVTTTLEYDGLIIDDHFRYQDVHADHIIFAEGYKARENPYFTEIRHQPVKGEVLLIKFDTPVELEKIVRHQLFVIPLGDNLYWVGSGYDRKFKDASPTTEEKERMINILDNILSIPYTVIDHKAAIRPSVLERRPRIGSHPTIKNMHLFAGMGTKGTSLAPYWAFALVENLISGKQLHREVQI